MTMHASPAPAAQPAPPAPTTLSRAEIDALGDEIATLFAQETILRQQRFERLRRFDDHKGWAVQGARSCAHWLSWRLGIDLKTAYEHVRVAQALRENPRIDAAFKRGQMSYSKVRALTRVATPKIEENLVELGLQTTATQLEKVARGYQKVVTTTGDDELARPAARRSFTRRDLPSGLVELVIRLRPEEAAVVLRSLEVTQTRMMEGAVESSAEDSSPGSPTSSGAASSAEDPAPGSPTRSGEESSAEDHSPRAPGSRAESSAEDSSTSRSPTPPPPSAEELRLRAVNRAVTRVDAFVATFEANLAYPPPGSVTGRHEVVLLVDARTGTGELPDGSRVGPETVRRLCCDSPILTLVERAVEKGAPRRIDVGRRSRAVRGALRRVLDIGDPTCCFPGCTNRRWLDAHHIVHWADGGATTVENLALTCRRHHALVHEGGFSMKQTPDGPVFFDPDGRKIEKAPPLPDLGADALAELAAARAESGIGPHTNAPQWDGSCLDLGGVVDGLLRVGAPEMFPARPPQPGDSPFPMEDDLLFPHPSFWKLKDPY